MNYTSFQLSLSTVDDLLCGAYTTPIKEGYMKLSNAKIEQLAADLVDHLAEVDGVMFQADDGRLRVAAQQIITEELMRRSSLSLKG
jgi:hypothetical protein